jgi:hypothetical protein
MMSPDVDVSKAPFEEMKDVRLAGSFLSNGGGAMPMNSNAVVAGPVVQHGDAGRDQLDMTELLGEDARHKAIESPQPKKPDPNAAAALQELLGGKYGEMSTLGNYMFPWSRSIRMNMSGALVVWDDGATVQRRMRSIIG